MAIQWLFCVVLPPGLIQMNKKQKTNKQNNNNKKSNLSLPKKSKIKQNKTRIISKGKGEFIAQFI